MKALRDTGAGISLILKDIWPFKFHETGDTILLRSIGNQETVVPLVSINIISDTVSGRIQVGVVDSFPLEGIQLILGNNMMNLESGQEKFSEMKSVRNNTAYKSTQTEVCNEKISLVVNTEFPSCGQMEIAENSGESNLTWDKVSLAGDCKNSHTNEVYSMGNVNKSELTWDNLSPAEVKDEISLGSEYPVDTESVIHIEHDHNDKDDSSSELNKEQQWQGKVHNIHMKTEKAETMSADVKDGTGEWRKQEEQCCTDSENDRGVYTLDSTINCPFGNSPIDISGIGVSVDSQVSKTGQEKEHSSQNEFIVDEIHESEEMVMPFHIIPLTENDDVLPKPEAYQETNSTNGIFPSQIQNNAEDLICMVTTRAMAKEENTKSNVSVDPIFQKLDVNMNNPGFHDDQKNDDSLKYLFASVKDKQDLEKVRKGFYMKNKVLMRKYMPPNANMDDFHMVKNQIVVPTKFRKSIIEIAHDNFHAGVKKTLQYIQRSFHWPTLKSEVKEYVKTCHVCQCSMKSHIPKYNLKPIKMQGEPFSRLLIDCVGPLPITKNKNIYIFTVMCPLTRFPEAFPLRNIRTGTILKCLYKYFSMFGVPEVVQSDQGSNFKSKIFQSALKKLGIKQIFSSPYRPQSQGALERYHKFLKDLLRTFCMENARDWDENLPCVLFASRHVVQESLGFSPFELVFGHSVRGPLEIVKHNILYKDDKNYTSYFVEFKERLSKALETADENLKQCQSNMKVRFDVKSKLRTFDVDDQVLAFIPIHFHPFKAKLLGPYRVLKKISDRNYLLETPDRKKKKQVFHINSLKEYHERKNANTPVVVNVCNAMPSELTHRTYIGSTEQDASQGQTFEQLGAYLENTEEELSHLSPSQQVDVTNLLLRYRGVLSDTPQVSDLPAYTINLTSNKPIQQTAFRVSPEKREIIRQHVNELLGEGKISTSHSTYSSPCFLVKKEDSFRLVMDYRRLNEITVGDRYPMHRIDDIIDCIANSKFLTTLDLKSGYHQIPLEENCKQLTAFATPVGLYEWNVLPFGLAGAPAAFQRAMNSVVQGLESFCVIYIDDIVVFSENWEDHLAHLESVLECLSNNHLTLNIKKLKIGKDSVNYLGHKIGNGQVSPLTAKTEAIKHFSEPKNVRAVRKFLGMANFYRKFVPNLAHWMTPLTELLKKNTKFVFSEKCRKAFEHIKCVLTQNPILRGPDFKREFFLATDASESGAGAVLMQEHDGINHPVAYFSKKFNEAQSKYSTIERELMSVLLSLRHFDIYLSSMHSVTVYCDHNPLTYLVRMRNSNARLMRWSVEIQRYNPKIVHIPGSQNVIADALSRV